MVRGGSCSLILSTVNSCSAQVILPIEFKFTESHKTVGFLNKDYETEVEIVKRTSKEARAIDVDVNHHQRLISKSATRYQSNRSNNTQLRTSKTPQLQEQLAIYALEMFSARGIRRHVLGLYFDTFAVEFWYYDRSAGYGSMPCSFGKDFRSLAILLLAIGRASAEQLGFEPYIRPASSVENLLSQAPVSSIPTKSDGASVKVNDRMFLIEDERLGKGRTLTGQGG